MARSHSTLLRKKLKKLRQKVAQKALYLIIRGLMFVSENISWKSRVKIGGLLGRIAYKLGSPLRKKAVTNIKYAYGDEVDEAELEKIVRKSFINMGRSVFEFLAASRLTLEELRKHITIKGSEKVEKYLQDNKGMIWVSSHTGNWEISAIYLALSGVPLYVVARDNPNKGLDKLLIGLREKTGVKNISRDSPHRKEAVRQCFEDGGVLGTLIDQDTKSVKGGFVEFFDRPAYTSTGAAGWALKYGIPVFTCLCARKDEDTHIMEINGPLEKVDTGNLDHDVQATTQIFSQAIENWIRKYPGQWVWVHDRWKTREKRQA